MGAFPFDDAVLETQAARVNGAHRQRESMGLQHGYVPHWPQRKQASKHTSCKAGKQASQQASSPAASGAIVEENKLLGAPA